MTLVDLPTVPLSSDFGTRHRLDMYGRIEAVQTFELYVTEPVERARLEVIERGLWDALAAAQSL